MAPLQLIFNHCMNSTKFVSFTSKIISGNTLINSGLTNPVGGLSLAQFRHNSCATNCLQARRLCWRWFKPDLHQYGSRVPCPCGLTVVYEISLPLARRGIACTEVN